MSRNPSIFKMWEEYISNTTTPLFAEFISYIGWTWKQFEDLDPNSKEHFFLHKIKEKLEINLEKQLVYQTNRKGFNYNILLSYLKKANPTRFGDKLLQVETKQAKTTGVLGDFENNSGVHLLDMENKS